MKKYFLLIFTVSFSFLFSEDPSPPSESIPFHPEVDPVVEEDSLGNKVAVWEEKGVILVSELPVNGNWSMPIVLSNALNTASSPQLEIDSSGEATVIWVENESLKAACRPFEGEWTPSLLTPTTVEETPAESPSLPKKILPPPKRLAIGLEPSEGKRLGQSMSDAPYPEVGSSGGTALKQLTIKSEKEIPLVKRLLPELTSGNAIDAPSGGSLTGAQIGFSSGTLPPSNGLIVSGNTSIGTNSNVNKLDVSGGVGIGTYAGVNAAPSNGLIVSGNVGIGQPSPAAATKLTVYSTDSYSYNTWITGFLATPDNFGEIFGLLSNPQFEPTVTTAIAAGLCSAPVFTPAGGTTLTTAVGLYTKIFPISGTITTAAGVYTDPNSSTIVTNAYGGYFSTPSAGTNKCAIYGGDLSIGYPGTTPPSSGAIVNGNVGIGTTITTNKLDVSGNAAIGSYAGVNTAPSNGLIVSGQTAIGTSSALSVAQLTLFTSMAYGAYFQGTQTAVDGGSDQYALITNGRLNPSTGSGISAGIYSANDYVAPSAKTIANAYGMYVYNVMHNNVGTITRAAGLFVESGSTGTGTITNAYGGYFVTPAYGATACALYADNLSVGYTATTPPASGAIISGQVGINTSNPDSGSLLNISGTQTAVDGGGFNQWSLYLNQTLKPADLTIASAAAYINSIFIAANTKRMNSAISLWINPDYSSTLGTITTAYGLLVQGGTGTTTGALTTNYSGYFSIPTAGATKTALYSDNLSVGYIGFNPPSSGAIVNGNTSIGTNSNVNKLDVSGNAAIGSYAGVNTAPSNGLIVSGQTAIGTSSALSVAQLTLFTSMAYGAYFQGTQTAVDGGSDQYALITNGRLNPSTGSGISAGIYSANDYVAPSAKTISNAYGVYVYNVMNNNSGTINRAAGLFVESGSTGTGTITNAYGGYFVTPAYGATASALYADNLLIGYTGTTPLTNGAYIQGHVAIGTTSVDANWYFTVDGTNTSTSTFKTNLESHGTLAPNVASSRLNGIASETVFACTNSTTTCAAANGIFITANIGSGSASNAGTITRVCGLYFAGLAPISTVTGTVTNSYGGYFENPGYGGTQCALYAVNLATGNYTGITPPSGGAIISGVVGIGKSSVGGGFALDVNGNVHATSFPSSSDTRLKQNFQRLENAVEKLMALECVTFDWADHYPADKRLRNKEGKKIRQIGLIAQQLEQVQPELVITYDLKDEGVLLYEDAKAVDYGRSTSLIIAAIQEINLRLKKLEERWGSP